jgi:hypothetical protein
MEPFNNEQRDIAAALSAIGGNPNTEHETFAHLLQSALQGVGWFRDPMQLYKHGFFSEPTVEVRHYGHGVANLWCTPETVDLTIYPIRLPDKDEARRKWSYQNLLKHVDAAWAPRGADRPSLETRVKEDSLYGRVLAITVPPKSRLDPEAIKSVPDIGELGRDEAARKAMYPYTSFLFDIGRRYMDAYDLAEDEHSNLLHPGTAKRT